MTLEMKNPMKRLTKIRLINWHYFTDETIDVNGSVLFSGENASGKSTILDAIQLVLTTNSNRFNPAANEKSKRKLNGYVRCKTGEEGNNYIRNGGAVIAYVSLEFYEESKDRYFVIGVKLDSPDVEAEITKKWFCVEGRMDTLSFIVGSRPAIDKEFTQNGKRIQYEPSVNKAKEMFRIRLGQLDSNFGDMIIKSMAFRPMDKVKDFINNFILPKNVVQTENLQENIRNLREMQKLITEVKNQISQLHAILEKANDINSKEQEILTIDILIRIAKLEDTKQKLEECSRNISADESMLSTYRNQQLAIEEDLRIATDKLRELDNIVRTNETGRLIARLEENIRSLSVKKAQQELLSEDYKKQLEKIRTAIRVLEINNIPLTALYTATAETTEKTEELEAVKNTLTDALDKAYRDNSMLSLKMDRLNERSRELEERIDKLSKNQIIYPSNTNALLVAINKEFESRRMDSKARVFADLLEIELPEWQNAVEGYLNSQRFSILVEPEQYDIAAAVYDRMKDRIHSVGLVNIGKIMALDHSQVEGTLAEAVRSDNRFARAFADYLLGRVIRCDTVQELKNHNVSITKTCMKYQGHVLSKIDRSIYQNPYIGKAALHIQLENAKAEYESIAKEKEEASVSKKRNEEIISVVSACNFEQTRSLMSAPQQLMELKNSIRSEEIELAAAKNNPTFIELSLKWDNAKQNVEALQRKLDSNKNSIINKERDIEEQNRAREIITIELETNQKVVQNNEKEYPTAFFNAQQRYQTNARTKSSRTIAENYGPRKVALENEKTKLRDEMVRLQARYKDGDFGTGMEVIRNYREDLEKLERSDLISYEDKLATIQQECELEFRENFLAKIRENIDKAEYIFSQLNKSLKGIYYGNDSYKFELIPNKQRQSLYDMITSNINISGDNLFSSAFEEKYHEEMEDLFSKLTDENLNDTKTIEELTDYRSYLDYDIQVISKEGRIQKFSKTYGEKSGGETQTPYYVAIAASFAQMYSGRETARIIMLDEAFNNMDEDRIESMMQFLNSQNFQIILAAPPSRMEVIGEHVDSIYLTIRHGNSSVVEEYFYEEL